MRSTLALLASAALLTSSSVAQATSPTCVPATLTSAAPADGETAMPRDARIVFVTDAGCHSKVSATLQTASGTAVSFVEAPEGFGNPFLHILTPVKPLAASTSYVLKVKEENAPIAELKFSTSDSTYAAPARAGHSLELGELAWLGSPNDSGDAWSSIKITGRQPGADRFGIYRLGKAGATDADFVPLTSVLAAGREAVPLDITGWSQQGREQCFTLRYEDALGNVSKQSAPACIRPATAPPPKGPDDEPPSSSHEASGCSMVHGATTRSGIGVLALVGVAIFASRRRRRAS